MITVTIRSTDRVLGRIAVEPEHGLVGRPWSEWEHAAISGTLKLTRGSKVATAKLLGIGVRSMYRKIEKYNLEHLCRPPTNPHPFRKTKKEPSRRKEDCNQDSFE